MGRQEMITSFIPLEWLVGLGATVIAALGLYLKGRKSAKQDAKVDALKQEVKGHEIRNEVENRVASERDARQRLRDEWSR